MAELIDGRKIAQEMKLAVKEQFEEIHSSSGHTAKLVSIIAGGEKEAELYLKAQERTASSIGIEFESCVFGGDIDQTGLISRIQQLNEDDSVTAVIVEYPLPEGIDYDKVITALKPEKDAEGIHPFNLGRIYRRDADIVPCTPGAVMKILTVNGVDLYGKDVVLIGHSPIVGKPLSLMMLNETATTTVCHIGTADKGDLKSYTRNADILVVAVGKPGMVQGDWVKEGVVVIDVGINHVDGKIVGDVDFEDVKGKAAMITPVPGGVGPITVAILMRNVLRAYRMQHG